MYSVEFAEIEKLQHQNEWEKAAGVLSRASLSIEKAGADFILICTNTMHKVFNEIQGSISVPMLHIADATAEQLIQDGITKVGLLGTGFTMKENFYKGRIKQKYNIEVIVPNQSDQNIVHKVIYDELCSGQIKDSSRINYLKIIKKLSEQGAQAVILGCTEIALLVQQHHTQVKLYDTTEIHCDAAVQLALKIND